MEMEFVDVMQPVVKLHARINELEAEKKAIESMPQKNSKERLRLIEAELESARNELKKAALKAAERQKKLDDLDMLDINITII